MMNAEYADNGKKVIIPVELWETFKDVFENIQLDELVREVRDQAVLRESEPEAGKNITMSRNDRLMKIFHESEGAYDMTIADYLRCPCKF